jgi:transcriptional regulator with XRE-family HTH domain
MADLLELAPRSYQHYEYEEREPSLTMLVRIADLLDVSVDYILGRDAFIMSRGVRADGYPLHPPNHPIS